MFTLCIQLDWICASPSNPGAGTAHHHASAHHRDHMPLSGPLWFIFLGLPPQDLDFKGIHLYQIIKHRQRNLLLLLIHPSQKGNHQPHLFVCAPHLFFLFYSFYSTVNLTSHTLIGLHHQSSQRSASSPCPAFSPKTSFVFGFFSLLSTCSSESRPFYIFRHNLLHPRQSFSRSTMLTFDTSSSSYCYHQIAPRR